MYFTFDVKLCELQKNFNYFTINVITHDDIRTHIGIVFL